MPRARVWLNGKAIGVSPTQYVRVNGGTVSVRVEHVVLGSAEQAFNVGAGEKAELTVVW